MLITQIHAWGVLQTHATVHNTNKTIYAQYFQEEVCGHKVWYVHTIPVGQAIICDVENSHSNFRNRKKQVFNFSKSVKSSTSVVYIGWGLGLGLGLGLGGELGVGVGLGSARASVRARAQGLFRLAGLGFLGFVFFTYIVVWLVYGVWGCPQEGGHHFIHTILSCIPQGCTPILERRET